MKEATIQALVDAALICSSIVFITRWGRTLITIIKLNKRKRQVDELEKEIYQLEKMISYNKQNQK